MRYGSLSQDHGWTPVPASVDTHLPQPRDRLQWSRSALAARIPTVQFLAPAVDTALSRWRRLPSLHPQGLGSSQTPGSSRAGGDGLLAGTPSTQSMSSRPREHECSPGLRSSGVQLRPCILQAETSIQAVEGQLRHCILQAEASMQAAEGPYCWSPIAAPLPEHRGAIASRGQQRPKMPLLLLPGKTKVLDWGPPCEVFENKKKRGGRGERGERGRKKRRMGERGRENRVESGVHVGMAGTLRWPSYPRPRGLFLKY